MRPRLGRRRRRNSPPRSEHAVDLRIRAQSAGRESHARRLSSSRALARVHARGRRHAPPAHLLPPLVVAVSPHPRTTFFSRARRVRARLHHDHRAAPRPARRRSPSGTARRLRRRTTSSARSSTTSSRGRRSCRSRPRRRHARTVRAASGALRPRERRRSCRRASFDRERCPRAANPSCREPLAPRNFPHLAPWTLAPRTLAPKEGQHLAPARARLASRASLVVGERSLLARGVLALAPFGRCDGRTDARAPLPHASLLTV